MPLTTSGDAGSDQRAPALNGGSIAAS